MKINQYQCMAELQDSLRKLYDSINYSPEEISIESPNGIVQAFVFANRKMSVNYIEKLTEQVREAVKISDGIRLDSWSEKEYQEELEKKVGKYEEAIKTYEKTVKSYENEMRDLISNVIAFRDGLLIKRDYLYSQGEKEGSAAVRIVEANLKETASLLKKSGVEILEDQGAFSSQRQTILDVKETEEESLDGQIAEVVRPGYSYQGEQLRGQEVIVYKFTK